MQIKFKINYHTTFGQNLYVGGSVKELGDWKNNKALKLKYLDDGNWEGSINLKSPVKDIHYKYYVGTDNEIQFSEWGKNREIKLPVITQELIVVNDCWRNPLNEEKVMYSSAFSDVIMKPETITTPKLSKAKKTLKFKISVARIGTNHRLCLLGNQKALGNWDSKKPLFLSCGKNFPQWEVEINSDRLQYPIEYKYGIYNTITNKLETLEEGENRYISDLKITAPSYKYINTDESFRFPVGNWKGAGVAVPVFSLRSNSSFGVGEFNDLIPFIDWAHSVGMKMVQLLPVNETIASHNWLDSYPYKSISVMALHPIYMNLEKMGALKDKKTNDHFASKAIKLNSETHANYPAVLEEKSKYYKYLFDQEKHSFFKNKDYLKFFNNNKQWLIPYAAFAYLRDKMKDPDFRKWTEYSIYNEKEIKKISSPNAPEWDDIAVHYFIQYHLDKQLKEVTDYAHSKGIVLKGDIPIGISPNSVEAWTEPHLYNLNGQAGAPPDDFAIKGQNWGFPTYNWDEMAKEDYQWWKNRLRKMSDYFDAYRIDHILGFFRIWEIPSDAVEGLLGHFKPALPMTVQEIESYNITFDYNRYTKPYIKHHLLHSIFGEDTPQVIHTFLDDDQYGNYNLKEQFNTQKKINEYFLKGIEEEELNDSQRAMRDGLFDLIANVLFVQTGNNEFHPRITLQNTSSFAELDNHTKEQISKIYYHFFYQRHDQFWYQQAMEKLPKIIEASNMLVCGEDLGMVPDCVPPAMNELCILSLEIQRMSKNPKLKFAHPANAPYLSVCTTSTHDMSTIRGWWEEDKNLIQEFYNQELGNHGSAPFYAEPETCIQIITQHMYSPAMWTTFPIQDLIAMDGDLRWEETQQEQINFPSNVRHHWRFRMKQSINDLQNATKFNQLLKNLIEASGRMSDY